MRRRKLTVSDSACGVRFDGCGAHAWRAQLGNLWGVSSRRFLPCWPLSWQTSTRERCSSSARACATHAVQRCLMLLRRHWAALRPGTKAEKADVTWSRRKLVEAVCARRRACGEWTDTPRARAGRRAACGRQFSQTPSVRATSVGEM